DPHTDAGSYSWWWWWWRWWRSCSAGSARANPDAHAYPHAYPHACPHAYPHADTDPGERGVGGWVHGWVP
ncbi:MAG: hypothetical protein J4N89_15485, partial [Chloroflexi bacterium]|nr:hypothetical protein [Chloroflexota bacterium]